MSEQLLNTHFYDTKISNYYQYILKTNNTTETFTTDQLNETLQQIESKIPNNINDDMKQFINKTIDLIRTNNNIDSTDNIDSGYLIVKIWEKMKDYTSPELYFFYEQLSDISSSGPCLQGRSKRLFEIYMCLYDK